MTKLGTFLLVVACFVPARANDLSKEAAGLTINKSLQSTMVEITLPVGRVGKKCADNHEVSSFDPTEDIVFVAAREAGILTVAPELGADGFWRVGISEGYPALVEALKKIPHKVANGCDYQNLRLYIARKELVDVVNVKSTTDGLAEVEYTWRWAPSKPFASLAEQLSPEQQKDLEAYLSSLYAPLSDPRFRVADLGHDAKSKTGKRTLKKSDDGWHLAFDQNLASDIVTTKLSHESKDFSVGIGKVGLHCREMAGDKEVDVNMDPERSLATIVLKKAGYVSVAPKEIGSWQVSLTGEGQPLKGAGAAHNTLAACDFQFVTFTIATQSLVKIVAIRGDEDAPEVEYLTKWVPTDLGLSLRANGGLYAKLTPVERDAVRRYLAGADFSPTLAFPIPSVQDLGATNRATVHLTRVKDFWLWK